MNRRRRTNRKILTGSGVVILILIIMIGFSPTPKPLYKVSAIKGLALSSSQLRVFFSVENVGKTAGTPTCTIEAESGIYNGDALGISPIDSSGNPLVMQPNPFSPIEMNDDITITNQGAMSISNSDITVTCS